MNNKFKPKKRIVDYDDIVIPASILKSANCLGHGDFIILYKKEMSPRTDDRFNDPFECFDNESHPLMDACDNCELIDFCEDDIHLPPCILLKAGMPVDADLELTFCDGGIFITESGEDGDYDE
jgi:hypothetical protein